jgi:hypothetical protein
MLAVLAALAFVTDLRAQNKACALATPDELKALLGASVSGLKGSSMPDGPELCMGNTPAANVLLRVAHRSAQEGEKASGATERAGIEMAKKMGAQVDVKTFGPITCSTMVPPANLQQYGFNTTCSFSKKTGVAAIEITAKTQKDMVPIERLRPLAEKMADRF